jgi:hypothetical protein
MITAEDITGIYTADNKYNPEGGATIHAKVAAAFPAGSQSHKIQCSSYDRVFFTSDIHADLRKIVQILQYNRLINPAVDPYAGNIYDPRLVSDSTWTGGERTLVVIVGDLVDGRRSFAHGVTNEVKDEKGSFEFLLFSLLFNLRMKARTEGSEILFTIGNHDFETIVKGGLALSSFVSDYVHTTAKSFFLDDNEKRSKAILPFLNACPFFMLGFYREDAPEMACVHAGFHTDYNTNVIEDLQRIQATVDTGTSLSTIALSESRFLGSAAGVLFGRKYGGRDATCDVFTGFSFPFVIVGHCPTSFSKRPMKVMGENQHLYKGCDIETGGNDDPKKVGCVVLDCHDSHDIHSAPKLAFVDITMTNGFRVPTVQIQGYQFTEINNRDRLGQMMLLTHDPVLQSDRYFNQIDRVAKIDADGVTKHSGLGAADGEDDTNTLLYKAAPVAATPQMVANEVGSPLTGGLQRRRSRRSSKKQKKQRQQRKRQSRRRRA